MLLQATVAAAFSYHPLPRAHAAVPMRHRAITAIAPLEGFDIPADAFDAPPPAALELGSSGGIVDVLVMVVFFFIGFNFMAPALGEDGDLFPGSTEEEEKPSRTSFGWLHADMRMPLPSLAMLQEACHPIGEHEGRQMYLCASAQPEGGIGSCERSADFSEYYGDTVYLCKGGALSVLHQNE